MLSEEQQEVPWALQQSFNIGQVVVKEVGLRYQTDKSKKRRMYWQGLCTTCFCTIEKTGRQFILGLKRKCTICSKQAKSEQMTLDGKNSFIDKCINKHNNFFTYTKVNYVNAKTHVIVTCPEHGDFLTLPGNHIQGSGCPKCKKTTDADVVYLWKLEVEGYSNLYKIGITSERLNTNRLHRTMNAIRKNNINTVAKPIIKKVTKRARTIEQILLTQFTNKPSIPLLKGVGGYSEFRYLTDEELQIAKHTIEGNL